MSLSKKVLLVALLFVAGCGTTTEEQLPESVLVPELPDNYVQYEHPDGWTMSHPNDWTVNESEYESTGVVGFISPSTKPMKANLTIVTSKTEFTEDLISYQDLKGTIETALQSTGGTNISTDVIMLPVGEAVQGMSTLSRNGVDLKIQQLQMYRDYKAFILNYMADTSEFDQYKDDVDLMLKTFNPGN